MDIVKALESIAVCLEERFLPGEAGIVRMAARTIQSQQTTLENIPSARFDRFFVAAISGLNAACEDCSEEYIVKRARTIAALAMRPDD